MNPVSHIKEKQDRYVNLMMARLRMRGLHNEEQGREVMLQKLDMERIVKGCFY